MMCKMWSGGIGLGQDKVRPMLSRVLEEKKGERMAKLQRDQMNILKEVRR